MHLVILKSFRATPLQSVIGGSGSVPVASEQCAHGRPGAGGRANLRAGTQKVIGSARTGGSGREGGQKVIGSAHTGGSQSASQSLTDSEDVRVSSSDR